MAGAIISVPAFYQTAFEGIWRDNPAQQTEHRLAGKYEITMVSGNQQRIDFIGSANYAMRQVTGRSQKSEPSDVPLYSRWVRVRPYDKTTWIDQFDATLLGSLPKPDGAVAKCHAIAAARQKDIVILNGLLGTNYTGAQGSVATTLPTTGGVLNIGQVVPVTYGSGGANSGLTLVKLTTASFLLDKNSIQFGGRHLAYSAKELNNLITNVDQVSNQLYNDVRALRDGRIRDFMGFEFTMTELVPFTSGSTTIRSCVAWQKECVHLGIGEDIASTIDRLPTQSNATQVYTCVLIDSSRTTESGVVEIDCDESV